MKEMNDMVCRKGDTPHENFVMLLHVNNGTVALPRVLCDEFPGNEVYIGAGTDRCLRIYTREQGDDLLRRCGADRRLRALAAVLCPAEICGGCLTIPRKLLNYAGIEDKVVVELTNEGVVIYRATTPDRDCER